MNQTQALAKLKKILGPNVGYRIDPKALDKAGRDASRAQAADLLAKKEAAGKAKTARINELLRNDPTYQALKAEFDALDKAHSSAVHWAYTDRITVGIVGKMFFSVKASGDNWAEVVEAAKEKVGS